MKYTPVGVDIAKHVMQVYFVDKYTGEVIDRQIKRDQFPYFFSNREACLIGMEACSGSQYWARELEKLGHTVRLMQARFVKAFLMGNKNDMMDARAIWMAIQQLGKVIAIKSEAQQAVLALHKMRRQLVKFRTAQINAIHALLLEFGETVHKGRAALDKAIPEVLERLREKLPPFLIYQIQDQYQRLSDLDEQTDSIEKQLAAWAKQNEACQRIIKIPGVGPLIATAAIATMGDVGAFHSGRNFTADIGLT